MEIGLNQKWQPHLAQWNLTQWIGKPLAWIAIGASAWALVGCNPANLVAQGIERELPQYVGPADRYDVEITGLDVGKGTAQSVLAVGERVRPEGAPVIERLALELEGVVFDRATESLSQVSGARLTAVIRTNDLVDFLETYRNVRSAEVRLRSPNYATLRVRPQLGAFSLPAGITVDVTGEIVGQGTRLNFEVSEVSAAGINVSSLAARGLSEAINPLADLQGLPVDVEIVGVMVAGETIGLEVIGDPSSLKL